MGRITVQEAKSLDPPLVRVTKQFYEEVFRQNPKNFAEKARVELMERILQLQGSP
jgi:hypothetical protein